MRVKVTLACTECKRRNYVTKKNKRNNPERIEMNKHCKFCRKHTLLKETKKANGGLFTMADEKKPGFFKRIASRITRFFKDTKGEMKKVIWPSKKAVINNTGVVVLDMVDFSICIGALDFLIDAVVGWLH